MSVVSLDTFGSADAWLDSLPLQLAWEEAQAFWWVHPYQFQAPDIFVERTNESEDLSENRLDSLFYGSNRSWHLGAGQKRLQVPNVSSPYAFNTSKGIDISVQGQATLLHSTSLVDTNTYTTQLQKIVVANDQLYFVGPTAGNLRKLTTTAGPGATIASGAPGDITSITTDGVDVYSCDGSHIGHNVAGAAGVELGSNVKANVVEWCKDQLFATGQHFGSPRYSFFTVSSAGTPTEIYRFTTNMKPVQIVELGPVIYIAVQSTVSSKSWIFAYDGTNAPFVALPMPDGDAVTSMTAFLGAGLLIGAQRSRDTNAQPGPIYIGFPQGSGHLVLLQHELVVLGDTDTNTGHLFTMARGTTWGRAVYFPWPYDDASGIGVYYPETAAYARHLFQGSGATGLVGGIAKWRGRMFFSVDGVGLFAENMTYLSSGNIVSSIIDLNNDVAKLWSRAETGFEALPANTSVQLEYSLDLGATWTSLGTDSTLNDTLSSYQPNIQGKRIQYRVTLGSSSTQVNSPTLYTARIGGWPIQSVKPEHVLVIRAYPGYEGRNGQQITNQRGGWDLFNNLATKRANGTVCDYQPPWWRLSGQTLKVRVSALSVLHGLSWGETGDAVGGVVQISLKEL